MSPEQVKYIALTVIVSVLAVCAMFAFIGVHSSANGRDVKVACVSHGGSWVEKQCVGVRP